jgi:hypothetical protein
MVPDGGLNQRAVWPHLRYYRKDTGTRQHGGRRVGSRSVGVLYLLNSRTAPGNPSMKIDQDLWDLTQRFVQDQLAILKRAGAPTELEPDAYERLVQITAEPGQALREIRGYTYDPPTSRLDTV